MIVLAGIGLVGFWVVLLAYLARDTWLRTLAERRGERKDGGIALIEDRTVQALAEARKALVAGEGAMADVAKLRADHHDRLHKLERERQAGPRRA